MVGRSGPVRWGIAGCGWVARDYVAPGIAASRNGRVALGYDLRPDATLGQATLGGAPVIGDLAAFLDDVDAVYVATPNHAHRALVEACAHAGRPVLCEKPMAPSLADAEAMVRACATAGVLYATAFDQRFHAAHRELARLLRDGLCGTVTAIRIVYACWVGPEFGDDNWRIDPARAGGGAMIDLAPHGLDLAAMLLDETLTEVVAMGQRRVQPYGVDDGAMLVARGGGGALVSLHVAYNHPESLPRRRLEVVGTRGMVVANDTMGQVPGGTVTFVDADGGRTRELVVPGAARSPFTAQAEAFADAVQGGPAFPYPPAHDLAIHRLVMRAQGML